MLLEPDLAKTATTCELVRQEESTVVAIDGLLLIAQILEEVGSGGNIRVTNVSRQQRQMRWVGCSGVANLATVSLVVIVEAKGCMCRRATNSTNRQR